MSTTTAAELPRLTTHPRETYLRQNETKIRSDAARFAKDDPALVKHLSAVEMTEDLCDYHEAVIAHFRKTGTTHRVPPHERYLAQAFQLKLHHLDQLAHLIL